MPLDPATLGLQPADRTAAAADLYADFVAVVRRLRRECPWDREQTHASVKDLTIEEAYEAVDAIEREDWGELKGELGDLLLHVVFHAEIAETTTGAFTLEDVIRFEMEKLVRRHPHVFGDPASGAGQAVAVAGTGEVLQNWEAIKRAERGSAEAPRGTLDGVPPHLPALLRAQRVQEKAAAVGFDFPDAEGAWAKVEEELGELKALADAAAGADALEDELGDVLFAVVNYGRLKGLTPEAALRRTLDKFSRRFGFVERRLHEAGTTPDAAGLAAMDRLWDEAKAAERTPTTD